ncbi:MAG: SDR family oxidoreductase [Chloroflexi bacterium]|nr:SDR family oxidoreductase [Chloroflexota bacterium]
MNLVTGAAGHIGNVLVRELLSRGEPVRALVLPGEDTASLDGLPIERVEGDILKPETLPPAFRGVQVVYHLAGIIFILPGRSDLVRRVNIEGTKNVLQAARQAGVKRLVYTSSIHAFQRLPDGATVDETIPFDPQSPTNEYDRSKAEASLAVLQSIHEGLDAVIVCPTGVIGPNDFRSSDMGNMIRSWMDPKIHMMVDGAFDFVDVRDVARGMILTAGRGKAGEVYLLAGENIRLVKLREMVQAEAGIHTGSLLIPLALAKQAALVAPFFYRLTRSKPAFTTYSLETVTGKMFVNAGKAYRDLGYQARSMVVTVADTVGWWRQFAFSAGRGLH